MLFKHASGFLAGLRSAAAAHYPGAGLTGRTRVLHDGRGVSNWQERARELGVGQQFAIEPRQFRAPLVDKLTIRVLVQDLFGG